MDQQMDQWTDGWRDKPSYKDARTPLKKENMQPFPFRLFLFFFFLFVTDDLLFGDYDLASLRYHVWRPSVVRPDP